MDNDLYYYIIDIILMDNDLYYYIIDIILMTV